MRDVSDTAVIEAMNLRFNLTAKEAEVLYLGVELRYAAASMAMTRIWQLHPLFEG